MIPKRASFVKKAELEKIKQEDLKQKVYTYGAP
jgi:hypothetical protein